MLEAFRDLRDKDTKSSGSSQRTGQNNWRDVKGKMSLGSKPKPKPTTLDQVCDSDSPLPMPVLVPPPQMVPSGERSDELSC